MGLRAVPFLGNDIGFGANPVGIFGQSPNCSNFYSAPLI